MKRRSKVIIRGIGWSAELRPLPFGWGYVSMEWRTVVLGNRHHWTAYSMSVRHWGTVTRVLGPTLRGVVAMTIERLTVIEPAPFGEVELRAVIDETNNDYLAGKRTKNPMEPQ